MPSGIHRFRATATAVIGAAVFGAIISRVFAGTRITFTTQILQNMLYQCKQSYREPDWQPGAVI